MRKSALRIAAATALAAAMVLAGCSSRSATPGSASPLKLGRPVALLVGELSYGRRIHVWRVGLDGSSEALPDANPTLGVRASADGRHILYLKPGPTPTELHSYDVASRKDSVLLTGNIVSFGWDGEDALAFAGTSSSRNIFQAGPPPGHDPPWDLRLLTYRPGAAVAATTALDEPSKPLKNISFLAADKDAVYFAGEELRGMSEEVQSVWRADRATGKLSLLAELGESPDFSPTGYRWSRVGGWYLRPQSDLPASTLLGRGLPAYGLVVVSRPDGRGTIIYGVLEAVAIRQLPDMSTLRSVPATPSAGPDDQQDLPIFNDTLARYLTVIPPYPRDGTFMTHTVTEVDARTGVARPIIVRTGRKHPDVLGYVDESTLAYASRDMTSEVVNLVDRNTLDSKPLARLNPVYEFPRYDPIDWQLLGVVREPSSPSSP